VLLAVLLIAAAAIAALSSGGSDTGNAPAVSTKHHAPSKKPKKKATTTSTTQSQAPAQTQQQPAPATTPTQTQSQTTPAPAATSDPAQMQLQAHNLLNQGKYAEAIALDKQVVAKGPGTGLTYAYALFDLGHALRVSGHPDQAIPILEQRLKINNQRGVVKQELEKAKKEAGSG
jgi:tetratricopeptide (TPR) repeat protein